MDLSGKALKSITAAILASFASAGDARADFWWVNQWSSEGYYRGSIAAEDEHLTFICAGNVVGDTRPMPHHPFLGRFGVAIELAEPALIPEYFPELPQYRDDITFTVDALTYRLPATELRFLEDLGLRWTAQIAMSDPLIADLVDGVRRLTIGSASAPLAVYESDGDLTDGLIRALRACIDQRVSHGDALPTGLAPELGGAGQSESRVAPQASVQPSQAAPVAPNGSASIGSDWRVSTFDNGAWFQGYAALQNGDVELICGGRSVEGLPLPQTDEPFITEPYTLYLNLWSPDLPRGTISASGTSRLDAAFVVDGVRYRLPALNWTEMNAHWLHWLSFGDPFLQALRTAETLRLDVAGGAVYDVPTDGLGDAVFAMLTYCDARWQRSATPVPDHAAQAVEALRAAVSNATANAPAAPRHQTPDRVQAMARLESTLSGHCQGPYEVSPESMTWTDLNSDGDQDLVFYWASLRCRQGLWADAPGGGNCGTSQCLASVFLSGSETSVEADAETMAQGVQTDPGRPGQIGFNRRLTVCTELQLGDECVDWMQWRNGALERVR